MQQHASTPSETKLLEKQKKADYDKQYRLKRQLLIQQQASTSSDTELFQQMQKKADYNKGYYLKRKLQRQEQASTSSETESPPSKRWYDGATEEEDEK